MKYIYIVSALAIFGMIGCATVPSVPEASKVIEETVRTKTESFRRNIKIEISQYDDARIENIYLEHRHKKTKKEEKDYLYVHGSVRNLSLSYISGIIARTKFFDAAGNLISDEVDDVIPRSMRRYGHGGSKGYFTIKTVYDPNITNCKMSLGRGWQISSFKELE
ncbi:MAG: hypothetical protein PHV55_06640 [Candidatus Omnitrophica bacterium]|nr:hypothetical protein [Candidatus Omnitrophota bacterium]